MCQNKYSIKVHLLHAQWHGISMFCCKLLRRKSDIQQTLFSENTKSVCRPLQKISQDLAKQI